ncbi:deoxyribose-phosphate aldolase [Bittarella massiliensis (ex Durand et al. 2017)]|uniref:deoxyribose-phosphate aldolase n=1 Tax=Bittarella massiliensis (ex Durand et al. 2017) TaxID=1720313 RepID=UPI001AA1103E|nr:deoxyribose-phosphate aldolase [Bittarella massiliensis (ex Durand et al. 2017)]MBO1679933.1 deoxyribose-phosphate aldolase [Bittarella massiliensis (ex Durand et al. 2017)]
MTQQEILAKVDHTLLKPESTWAQIKQICDDAIEYKTASICINPCYVKRAVEYLNGRVPVCTVIGFPLGATPTAVKVFEAKQALADGAEEFDMVINIGALKDGDYEYVKQDIAALKEAVGDHVLKVIIETCLLTDEEKEKMCDIVVEAGADFIKTSTGFSTAGATFHDIELFNRCVAGRCKIKAAGGIKSVDDMEKFVSLGADRLGTSSAIKLLKNQETGGAY